MTATEHQEIERKYDVAGGAELPSLVTLPGVDHVEVRPAEELDAIYVDTADLALARARITLRRRTGGKDAGWHLKLPARKDVRRELHAPLGEEPTREDGSLDLQRLQVPAELLPHVLAHTRGRDITPVVRLTNQRTTAELYAGEQRTFLAEVCADRVTATPLREGLTASAWSEWEVELVDGPLSLLDAVEGVLLAAGARPASGPSKLVRALGSLAPRPVAIHAVPDRPTAGQVMMAALQSTVERLKAEDAGARLSAPDAVHQMRVASRRLRTLLSTYGPLLDPDTTTHLREELKVLAETLGGVRDSEVMRERLLALVEAQPAQAVLGPVSERIEAEMAKDYARAHARLVRGLEHERYYALLDALDELVATPPTTPLAQEKAQLVVPRLLGRDWRRMRRAVVQATREDDPARAEDALHEVRKGAKRLRYAAESTGVVLGLRAKQLARSAAALSEVLGEHQDSVITQEAIRDLGMRAQRHGEPVHLRPAGGDRGGRARTARVQGLPQGPRRRPQASPQGLEEGLSRAGLVGWGTDHLARRG
ncbi:CHAD domain-containing protein [Arsenicicoccus dermatophilus]|uniref:CYTH and CHAD domain-containing protein n=1 Tax=Arsenicicoccus dermatophilus TaxID=1076331 RepID=UPI001F4C86AE|nr:CYTH and CHAD domain-containing protein [Arsenicicoccus dermatophilus]